MRFTLKCPSAVQTYVNAICNFYVTFYKKLLCKTSDTALYNPKAPKPRTHLLIRRHPATCCSPMATLCSANWVYLRQNIHPKAFIFGNPLKMNQLFSKYLVSQEGYVWTDLCLCSKNRFLCGFAGAGVNLGDSQKRRQISCTHQLCRFCNAVHL